MNVFETEAARYERWFEKHPGTYQSELAAIREIVPESGRGLEIGTGTGLFSVPFGIVDGVEPASAMRQVALDRGLNVLDAKAEALPFDDETFDFALMVTTICFVDDPLQTCREAWRVLKPGGRLVIGLVDLDSELGQQYEVRKSESPFYRTARFVSASETIQLLDDAGFCNFRCRQTLFHPMNGSEAVEPARKGFGEGGFVVVSGQRP
ncbi:MAG: class I SAM-dependent methyltransferase [Verrucomicrobiota bacterium]